VSLGSWSFLPGTLGGEAIRQLRTPASNHGSEPTKKLRLPKPQTSSPLGPPPGHRQQRNIALVHYFSCQIYHHRRFVSTYSSRLFFGLLAKTRGAHFRYRPTGAPPQVQLGSRISSHLTPGQVRAYVNRNTLTQDRWPSITAPYIILLVPVEVCRLSCCSYTGVKFAQTSQPLSQPHTHTLSPSPSPRIFDSLIAALVLRGPTTARGAKKKDKRRYLVRPLPSLRKPLHFLTFG
jgi:hypothetical protein